MADSLRSPRDWDQNSVSSLEKELIHTDNLVGLYYPTRQDSEDFEVKTFSDETLPVPPERFWHWYATSEKKYLGGGAHHANQFRKAAKLGGYSFRPGTRILDFGCSGGRLTRWFLDDARKGVEVWGCDIDAPAIEWCQKNMMPPFRFFANTTSPHLPFRDQFFDFVYAGSVVNHIKDMGFAWMMEIARCMKPGGIFVPTIIDENSLPLLYDAYGKDKTNILPNFIHDNEITAEKIQRKGFINRYSTSSPWLIGVIYSQEFFVRRASAVFDIVDIIPNLKGYQTGYVLRAL